MSLTTLKRNIISWYINSRGWKTDRKIVVIESDDWGSIRMPSKEVYNELLAKGMPVDKLEYLKYDSLESNKDLKSLLDLLISFRDTNGKHPVITANTIMTNPDFEKIRNSDFQEYHYELFTETLNRYPEHEKVIQLYKKGLENKVFFPQFHGREHLNINRWMKALQNSNSNARKAFDRNFFDLSTRYDEITEDRFVDALNASVNEDIDDQGKRLTEGAQLFENIFGFRSRSFIAPCYIWHPKIEQYLEKIGVNIIQTSSLQRVPILNEKNRFAKIIHFTGERNRNNQVYQVRNCFFEPSSKSKNPESNIGETMKQIDKAFKFKKPAIICTHRLNFIGFIDEKNRINNLILLKNLLSSLLKKWPDVEFMNSVELGSLILNESCKTYQQ